MIIFRYKNNSVPSLNESQSGNNTSNVWIKSNGECVDMETVHIAMTAAMQDIGIHYPSVDEVLKHKDIIYTDDPRIQTMATDGISIFINPAFAEYLIDKHDVVGLEFVLIHETLHVLFDHCYEHRKKRDDFPDAIKVNMAQDYEINFVIENFMREGAGLAPFKGLTNKIGGCYNEEFGKKGLTWEEIYSQIPTQKIHKKLAKTSEEWKRGFADGYNEVINQLRKQKLVERYAI